MEVCFKSFLVFFQASSLVQPGTSCGPPSRSPSSSFCSPPSYDTENNNNNKNNDPVSNGGGGLSASSPSSGYVWPHGGNANNGPAASSSSCRSLGTGPSPAYDSMAGTPEGEDDSGTGTTATTSRARRATNTTPAVDSSKNDSESHVIKHIDKNILSCHVCWQRYKVPKVRTPSSTECTLMNHHHNFAEQRERKISRVFLACKEESF